MVPGGNALSTVARRSPLSVNSVRRSSPLIRTREFGEKLLPDTVIVDCMLSELSVLGATLLIVGTTGLADGVAEGELLTEAPFPVTACCWAVIWSDRKSTRLNSSHVSES